MTMSKSMRIVLLALVSLIATYLVAWLLVYTWVMETDMTYLAEYMRLGWYGGGETPTLIQLYALALTGAASVVVAIVLLVRRVRKRVDRIHTEGR